MNRPIATTSARAIADDLEHWLADEPVSVYREPWPTRLARWGRRHKTAVAAGVALLVTALSAMGVSNVLIRREQQRTLHNYQLARSAVEQMLTEVGAVELADVPQMELVRRHLLDRALAFYQTFVREHRDDRSLRPELGRAHGRLGDITECLGQYDSAENDYRQAIALLNVPGGDAETRRALARNWHGLALLLKKSNRFHESEAAIRKALVLRDELGGLAEAGQDDTRALADSRYHLGALLARQGGHEQEVEDAYRAAIAARKSLGEDRLDDLGDRSRYVNNFGILLWSTGRVKEAESAFRDAIRDLEAATRAAPGAATYRWQLARCHANLGVQLFRLQRASDAESADRAAVVLLEGLVGDFPRIPDYRRELAVTLNNLGILLQTVQPSRSDEAERVFRRALDLQRTLADAFPRVPDHLQKLAVTVISLANLIEGSAPNQAEALYQSALTTQNGLLSRYPTVPEYQSACARIAYNQARLRFDRGDGKGARALLEESTTHGRRALAASPRDPTYRLNLLEETGTLAAVLKSLNDHQALAETARQIPEIAPEEPAVYLRPAAFLAQASRLAAEDAAIAPSDRERLSRGLADEAVKMLQAAYDHGFRDASILDDPDFDPIKNHPGYTRLRRGWNASTTSSAT